MNKTYKSGMMALSAVAFFTSCSESESLQQAHLSTDQINFIASMAHQWDANTKSAPQNPSSRSAGVRDNEAPIHVNANLAKPLYLHPVVQDGIHIWSKQGTPITRSGAPIEDMKQERVVQTRGSMKTGLSDYSKFGVTALYQNGDAYVSLFDDATATNSGKYWNIPDASNSTWPIGSKVSFHAYAPHSSESNSMLSSSPDRTNVQTNIHYTASSADIEKQPDLIVATKAAQRSKTAANTPVDLQFSHALTAVSFAMSRDLADVIGNGAQLTSVSLMGIPNGGDCQLIAQDDKHSSSSANWNLGSAKGTYTFDLSAKNITVGSDMALTDANQTLMMIPQTLPDGAKLEFTFKLNSQTQVLTVNLKGQKWEAGQSVIYKLSAKAINTLDATAVTYPSTWTASSFPKSSFTTNDAIGLYVVDKNNQIVERNVKLTLGSDDKWTTSKKFLMLTGYKYFAYYPYSPTAPMVNTAAADKTATEFFAKTISSLSLVSNQSDQKTLLAQDFQVAKGVVAEDASTLTFPMEHSMGLAVLNRESKSLDHFYKLKGYEDYTWSNGSVPTTANGIISSGQKLFSTTATQGIMVVAPNSTVTFTNTSTDKDEWKTKSVSITINEGNKVYSGEAQLKRQHYDETYTMKVGDIYYSDGAMTHQSEALASGKTPIGIVGYIGSDYWTEKDVVISGKPVGGHALVMCLKTIGSTGSTVEAQEDYKINKDNGAKVKAYIGTRYAWYSSNSDTGRKPFVDSKDLIVNSNNQTYGSGYTDTNYLINKWNSEAAAAFHAKIYNTLPANSSKCTGWFLPSAGQYYAVMSQLGGGISPDTWEINEYFGNMTTVTKNINNKLKKVGDSNHTEFFGDINTWAWTSSEFSSTYAVRVDSGIDDSKESGSVRFDGYGYGFGTKRFLLPVRPFLAF
ncbi:fimbrillin family protein [Segatella copri]|uniref:fimbrillin family protein n=1 Tax=Segatella copri TaxID=165179 RepID=UPI0011839983|nr:fimbrillin family protein [Segatella copri]